MFKGIKLAAIARKLNKRMDANFEAFIYESPIGVTVKSLNVVSTDTGVAIRYAINNYPDHIDFYVNDGDNRHEGFSETTLYIDLDLTNGDDESYYNEVYNAFIKHAHSLIVFISEAIAFLDEHVSCKVKVSTPRGHFGTYMASKDGIKFDGNIIRFQDPYTMEEHTFTAPFKYTRTDVKYLTKTKCKQYNQSSYQYY